MASSPAAPEFAASERALLAALDDVRREAGKPALKISPGLTRFARDESASAAAAGGFSMRGTDRIREGSGYSSIGKLQGTLKDRGTATGANFVTYWRNDSIELVSEGWTEAGVGIAKSADGRLFAVLILGGSQAGGASLMEPALSPGEFQRLRRPR